jgi:elongation factor P
MEIRSMAMKITEFSRGQGIYWRDGIWLLQNMEHVKPGKGPAYVQAELRNAETGQLVNNRFRSEEQVEPVHFDRKKMEYLYSDGSNHVFMDPDSYEQVNVPTQFVGDQGVYLQPNIECEVCLVDGRIITLDLPNTIEVEVVDTPPQVKGATATNQPKDAVCAGGAMVRVPPFVENGTKIRVDTRTGEYLGRV